MSSVNTTDAHVASILAKYSAEEVAILVDAAMSMRVLNAHKVDAPVLVGPQRKKPSKKMTASKVAKQSVDTFVTPPGYVKPSRPLNSWMAFRSYYAPIFSSYQQKNISSLLKVMWGEDPFKAKWAIVARAYSMIRTYASKSDAPVDEFLNLVCPHIGLIPMGDYLGVMGWAVVPDQGLTRLENCFTPDFTSFPDDLMTTNMSAENVVAYCYHVGLAVPASGGTSNVNVGSVVPAGSNIPSAQPPAASLTMAVMPASYSPVTMKGADDNDLSNASDMAARIDFALRNNNNNAAGSSSQLRQTVHDLSLQSNRIVTQFSPFTLEELVWDPSHNDGVGYSIDHLGTYLAPGDCEFPETFDVSEFLNKDFFEQTK